MQYVTNSNREVVNQTKEIQAKSDYFEKKIEQLLQDVTKMTAFKIDKSEFDDGIKDIQSDVSMIDNGLCGVVNNSHRVETYVENYLNIRIQNIVAQTLRACLTGAPRRHHEKYVQEKMQILYKNIVEDDGEPGNIEKVIMRLDEEAKKSVADYEELVKRKEEQKKRKSLSKSATPAGGTDEKQSRSSSILKKSVKISEHPEKETHEDELMEDSFLQSNMQVINEEIDPEDKHIKEKGTQSSPSVIRDN